MEHAMTMPRMGIDKGRLWTFVLISLVVGVIVGMGVSRKSDSWTPDRVFTIRVLDERNIFDHQVISLSEPVQRNHVWMYKDLKGEWVPLPMQSQDCSFGVEEFGT